MAQIVQVKCKQCKEEFTARVADRNRGWAKFCSKSCKAKEQESRTGQYSNYVFGATMGDENRAGISSHWNDDEGWDGHKD